MTYRLQIPSAAKQDLEQARLWHEQSRASLGKDFIHSAEDTFVRILHYPLAYPLVKDPYRRALIRRFSYIALFRLENTVITVSAVYHTSRQPLLWHKRLAIH